MTTRLIRTFVGSLLVFVGCWGSTGVAVQPDPQPLPEAGFGFVFRSTDFGNPCTTDPGDIPRIYDNLSVAPVDVSFKVINTGGSNLFISTLAAGGPVIPPAGPQQRPRVMRMTVAPGDSIGIKGQAANCGWTAIIRPH